MQAIVLGIMLLSTVAGIALLWFTEPSAEREAAVAVLFVSYLCSAVYLWRKAENQS